MLGVSIINENNTKQTMETKGSEYTQSFVDIKEILTTPENFYDKIVKVCGWIKTFRGGKKLGFLKLSDGSHVHGLQIVFSDANSDDFKTGTSMSIVGKIVKSLGKGQNVEMHAEKWEIHGKITNPESYPIAKVELSMDYLRGIPHLRTRTDTFQAIRRIESELKYGIDKFFHKHGFIKVKVPCITSSDCEGAGEVFTVTTLNGSSDYSQDFFKKRCYLTVSGQLHLEALVLGGLQKAYTETTAFRSEKSMGPRHLCEFTMLELEFCFSTLEDNMKVNEGLIKAGLQRVLDKCMPDLEFLQNKLKPDLIETIKKYITQPFVVSTHKECVQIMLDDIKSGKVKIDPEKVPESGLMVFREAPGYSDDLSKDHERYITEVIYKGSPVFVRHFPAKIKAFYMPKVDVGSDVEHVDGFDLLFPLIGEVVGGSQRCYDYDELQQRMKEMNVSPEPLEYYSELRKYGSVPHGGSGVGLSRLLMICTGIFNIKDMETFPRSYESCLF